MEIIRYSNRKNIDLFKNGKIKIGNFMGRTDEKLNDERNHTWKKYWIKDIPIKIIIPDKEE